MALPYLLDGNSITLSQAAAIAHGAPVAISPYIRQKVDSSRNYIEQLLDSNQTIYGVNTGFGYLAKEKIPLDELEELQVNLLRSHAAGHGAPLSEQETRLAIALRLNVLLKGYSGTRFTICEQLEKLLHAAIYPIIPEYGSVGASGDLAPLAHLALALIGEGKVSYQGTTMPAAEALHQANFTPISLAPKEGLTLINGTQIMGAVGGLALEQGWQICALSHKIAALSLEAFCGSMQALHPYIHQARNQKGQIHVAEVMRNQLIDSKFFTKENAPERVQDPYSMRCTPQVHGATVDTLEHAICILEREFNAATDNPLVFAEEKEVLSGGNFHGQPIAMAFEMATMAIAELANISERRIELLLNSHYSHLPTFLTERPGTRSGYMIAQYLCASLVNENKILSHPAVTDSIPGNVGIEDHVSMGMTSARKLKKVVENTMTTLATEWILACQALDLRHGGHALIEKLGLGNRKLYSHMRGAVPKLEEDRIIAEDIDIAVRLTKTWIGESHATNGDLHPLREGNTTSIAGSSTTTFEPVG